MLAFESYSGTMEDWEGLLTTFPDHQIFQTPPWLAFVAEAQNAAPVLAVLKDGGEMVGCFAGLVFRKFGLKILGSPFPGWTTSYMGIRLRKGTSKHEALDALVRYAFRDLGCVHLEMQDRAFTTEDAAGLGFFHKVLSGFEIDLHQSEDELFSAMSGACRRCIRKAEKSGVIIEKAHDEAFTEDFYVQLEDVFAKQSLVPTFDRRRVQLLVKHLLPTGRLLLVRARDPEGTCIATGIFPAMNTHMYFWGGASWRAHQHLRPNEAVQWYAMRYWKSRGIPFYDMVGGGEYKRKYGGQGFRTNWLRKSRFRALELGRQVAKHLFGWKQHFLGRGKT